jgi:hypothetical protein
MKLPEGATAGVIGGIALRRYTNVVAKPLAAFVHGMVERFERDKRWKIV